MTQIKLEGLKKDLEKQPFFSTLEVGKNFCDGALMWVHSHLNRMRVGDI